LGNPARDDTRCPYPVSAEHFQAYVAIGRELVSLHLLEHPVLDTIRHRYLGTGDNVVAKGYPQLRQTSEVSKTSEVFINYLRVLVALAETERLMQELALLSYGADA